MTTKQIVMMAIMAVLMLIGLFFVGQGVLMHADVDTEEEKFHDLNAAYFELSKAERDGAETGSDLNEDLVEIVNYPSELLRLKLVGVGKMLTGIFVLLFGILMALVMMPKRLGDVISKHGGGASGTVPLIPNVGSGPSAPSLAGTIDRFDDSGNWAFILNRAGDWYAFQRAQLDPSVTWDAALIGKTASFEANVAPDRAAGKAGTASWVRVD